MGTAANSNSDLGAIIGKVSYQSEQHKVVTNRQGSGSVDSLPSDQLRTNNRGGKGF